MAALTCDFERSARRTRELHEYLSASVLRDEHLVCRHYGRCRSSHFGVFFEGQLHHVGHSYDLLRDSRPLRIMVVGQEYGGGPAMVTLDERYRMVYQGSGIGSRFKADGVHRARNPHMRGTTSVLRLLFGLPLGTDHQSELLEVSGRQVHLFDAFALVNYLLCTAIASDGGSRGCSTAAMRENCRGHFCQALDILDPTVVVVQGKGFWPLVKRCFDTSRRVSDSLHLARRGSCRAHVAVFSHPSAMGESNWGLNDHTPYLLETVVPTVLALRRSLSASPAP